MATLEASTWRIGGCWRLLLLVIFLTANLLATYVRYLRYAYLSSSVGDGHTGGQHLEDWRLLEAAAAHLSNG
jgi:hypothetical protein